MTWDDFIEYVEEKGVTGDMEIDYIDFYGDDGDPVVVIDSDEFRID